MQTRAVAAVAGMLVLAGCGNAHQAAGNVPTGSPPASMSNAVPYSLYTHCGIDWARINGRWYQASPPLSDGSGNPPAGWGNPDQQGTIQVISSTEAELTDSAGHHVRFVLRPGARAPHRFALRVYGIAPYSGTCPDRGRRRQRRPVRCTRLLTAMTANPSTSADFRSAI